MGSPGELVSAMADTLGVPRATVAQYDRVLAENGLRSSGGRGLSAAKVTAGDAANLLIAIMGSPISGAPIKEAAKTCKLYGGLLSGVNAFPKYFYGFKRLANLPAEHPLQQALIALIDDAYNVDTDYVIIWLDSPTPGGEIYIGRDGSVREKCTNLYYSSSKRRSRLAGAIQKDLGQRRLVTFDTVKRLAAIVGSGEKQHRRVFHGQAIG